MSITTAVSRITLKPLVVILLLAVVTSSIRSVVAQDNEARESGAREHEAVTEQLITETDRDHWAFKPLAFTVPADTGDVRIENPIDLFVAAKQKRFGLTSLPPLHRAKLVRRLSLILHGMNPDIDEIAAFSIAESPDAYHSLVSRYLTSPRFGEREALYWLDLARFAETDGFEHDLVRKNAWQYRDWVIKAFNQDMPYDQFIAYQLAGDEIEPDSEAAKHATMFCLSGPDMPDINSQVERRHQLLNEMTGTVGAVLLGLQVGCAECHEHKYDPISQHDFYRLRAVFQPAVHVTKNKSVSHMREKRSDEKSYLMIRGDFRRQGEQLHAAAPRVLSKNWSPIVDRQADDHTAGRRTALANWITGENSALAARVMANRVWQHCFGNALVSTPNDFGAMGNAATHSELLDYLAHELIEAGWSIKQLYFKILTSATFQQASKPEDCDDVELAKAAFEHTIKVDPENDYLARFPARRIEGEAIRDCMLMCSGELNLQMGGPGVRPPLQKEVATTLLKGQWEVDPDRSQHVRRSVYVFARRNLRYPFFEAFDRPDANISCPARQTSTTPPQALILINSELVMNSARRFAGNVLRQQPTDQQFIIRCFNMAIGRDPTDEEMQASIEFIIKIRDDLRTRETNEDEPLYTPVPMPNWLPETDATAYTYYAMVIYNMMEFVYLP